jgi:phenylacetic acid degradation operon negative regulatory protein
VVASVLLGTEPPVMPARALVRAAALFGIHEGTARTAMSRMVAAGELRRRDDGRYELAGHLVQRQARQLAGRSMPGGPWSGAWQMWVVEPGARGSSERAELRRAAAALRLAEWREGVWLRPANLEQRRFAGERDVLRSQAREVSAHPHDDAALAASLWDLDGWSAAARSLRRELAEQSGALAEEGPSALRPGFEVSAAVLRHLTADPLLPRELLPRRWEGDRLRADYDRFDAAYRVVLRGWLTADGTGG